MTSRSSWPSSGGHSRRGDPGRQPRNLVGEGDVLLGLAVEGGTMLSVTSNTMRSVPLPDSADAWPLTGVAKTRFTAAPERPWPSPLRLRPQASRRSPPPRRPSPSPSACRARAERAGRVVHLDREVQPRALLVMSPMIMVRPSGISGCVGYQRPPAMLEGSFPPPRLSWRSHNLRPGAECSRVVQALLLTSPPPPRQV